MVNTRPSNDQSNDDQQNGDSYDPNVVPPDLDSAKQKARERGHWVREAILKGSVSGAIRAILEEGMNHIL